MPRSDLLIDMVEAGQRGDRQRFRAVVDAVIAEERAKQHHLVADRLTEIVSTAGTSASGTGGVSSVDLFIERAPERRLADVELRQETRALVSELIEEHHRSDVLRAHNLEPRHRVMRLEQRFERRRTRNRHPSGAAIEP